MDNEERFIFFDQKVKDILRTIQVIEPVIDCLCQHHIVRQETGLILSLQSHYNAKIEAYKKILKSKPDVALTEALQSKIRQYRKKIKDLMPRFKEDKEYLSELIEEIQEYSAYIGSFCWLNVCLAEEVFSRIPKEDKRICIAAVLLFTNENINEEESEKIFNFLYDFIVDEELKNAIVSLHGTNEKALFEYIVQTFIE